MLSLDPASHDHALRHVLPARALIVGGLPLAYNEKLGLVHLVKWAIPTKFYEDLGIVYKSPFQAKFMVALHRCE